MGRAGGVFFCTHPLRASSSRAVHRSRERSTAQGQRGMHHRPLCPALISLHAQTGSFPILGRVKAFPLLNPQCREPLFNEMAQGWIFLLCHAPSNPPPCPGIPPASLGTAFNSHTHTTNTQIPKPAAHLALPVLFSPQSPHKDTSVPP